MEKKRVVLVDELRGFAVVAMVIYHLLYSLSNIFGVNIGSVAEAMMRVLQPVFAGLFILIAGFSCRLSRSNIRRGLVVLLAAWAISLATILLIPSQAIYFGILHFLGVSMLLYGLAEKRIAVPSRTASFVLLLVLFMATFSLPEGFLRLPVLGKVPVAVQPVLWMAPIGLPTAGFYSADYFPLIPWFFLFLSGAVAGGFAKDSRLSAFAYKGRVPMLSAVGKRSLPIYITHQPIIIFVLWLGFTVFSL